ncbi:ATP-binding protein [Candidatus Poriferisodalis sp.]|uniref:ATP-binding protein n=1 Tax=Candidatus Poriferisodalis sp. TaxID=3101277 RepID=UPI003B0120B9
MDATLTPVGYVERVVDGEISEALASTPVVVVEGAKACGKTWTARRHARSEASFEQDEQAREQARLLPRQFLDGREPRLIDEWQIVPEIWNSIRHLSDEERRHGRFILTGTARLADDGIRHSGAGRIMRIRLRPMSLSESGASTREVSLGDLVNGAPCVAGRPDLGVPDIAEALCRGGWPEHLGLAVVPAQRRLRSYLNEIARVDVSQFGSEGGRRRDPQKVGRLLASIARNTSTTASIAKLASDTGGVAEGVQAQDQRTTAAYLDALTALFVTEDVPSWSASLRSRARLQKSPKRHLVDPSLAAAALRAGPNRLLSDLKTFGFLFESLVVRDLRVYAQAHEASVWHYRDSHGDEIDAIVDWGDGRWMAVEVKLGSMNAVDEAAGTLNRVCGKVDSALTGPPARKVVITASGYGYGRPDGVAVLPLSALTV